MSTCRDYADEVAQPIPDVGSPAPPYAIIRANDRISRAAAKSRQVRKKRDGGERLRSDQGLRSFHDLESGIVCFLFSGPAKNPLGLVK